MNRGLRSELYLLRKLLLSLVRIAVLTLLPVVVGFAHIARVNAQAAAEDPAVGIVGTWQGTLYVEEAKLRGLRFDPGRDIRLVIKISKADDGLYKGLCHSIDQSADPIPVANVSFDGESVKMSIPYQRSHYEGKLAADGRTITGFIWSNDVGRGPNPMPLDLTRPTAETEWTLPPPPPRLPPMDPNATPRFQVTIESSKSDQPHAAFHLVQGNKARGIKITLSDLISFAYHIHPNQAIGIPAWVGTDRFDIEVNSEGESAPGTKQWGGMLQKLIADRFKLTFHREMRELPAYALSVYSTSLKLTKSKADPNDPPSLAFGAPGTLHGTSTSMADFTQAMQAVVLDKPVVDQTGLEGRFDFDLNWAPDDSQFPGIEAKIPSSLEGANATPPLDKAIEEQLGLKLDAVTASMEVLVVDHVEKPSELKN